MSIISPGYHADPESKGLYIQVSKGVNSFKRSWIFRYTSPTLFKGREMGLGSLETRSLADARRKTLELRQLVMDGIDPTEDRCKAKSKRITAINSGITFKEAAERCIEGRKAEWKSSKHADQWKNTISDCQRLVALSCEARCICARSFDSSISSSFCLRVYCNKSCSCSISSCLSLIRSS